MQVAQYTFQSPSTQQVQIGKPDTSAKQEESSSATPAIVDETVSQAKQFAATQVSEVTPTVNSNQLLDVYA